MSREDSNRVSAFSQLCDELDRAGYFVAPRYITPEVCAEIGGMLPRSGARGGVRHLLQHEAVRRILKTPELIALVAVLVADDAVAINATLFNKTAHANWKVPWHQDRMVPVCRRGPAEGFGPWSLKAGVPHVEPPVRTLERVLALRVHFDDCDDENGPLRVIPSSHNRGKLSPDALTGLVATTEAVTLPVARGTVIGMRPLLVHASSVAHVPTTRRVLHIEFAPRGGISPCEWACALPMLGGHTHFRVASSSSPEGS